MIDDGVVRVVDLGDDPRIVGHSLGHVDGGGVLHDELLGVVSMAQPHLDLSAQAGVVGRVGAEEVVDLVEIVVGMRSDVLQLLRRPAVDDGRQLARSEHAGSGRVGVVGLGPDGRFRGRLLVVDQGEVGDLAAERGVDQLGPEPQRLHVLGVLPVCHYSSFLSSKADVTGLQRRLLEQGDASCEECPTGSP